jgi:hypothetical protein
VGRVDRTAQSVQDEFDIALYIARDNPPAAKRLLNSSTINFNCSPSFPASGKLAMI